MRNLLYIYPIIIVIAFSSCVPKPIDIQLAEAPTKLVISSQVIPNSIMVVSVSKSFGALSYSEENDTTSQQELLNQLLVDGATVTISYNGITDTLFPIPDAPGVYVSVTTPQFLNTSYDLYVHDPETGEVVTSQTNMLQQVSFNSVSAQHINSSGTDKIKVNYEFLDPDSEHNWYMVNFYTRSNDGAQSGSPFEISDVPTETLLLNDISFENNLVQAEHELLEWVEDTVLVSISNISEEYYDYLSLRLKSENFFTDIVKEPLNYPTNVVGGYGYFTSHFPDVKVVEVQ